MTAPTVACLLRASKDFTPDYVVRLYEAVSEHWTGPLRFLCLTDTPIWHDGIEVRALEHDWPGYWAKLEFFRPDIPGRLLTFDLDTMIVGSLEQIQSQGRHTMLRRFHPKFPHDLASGMMMLPEEVRSVVWMNWLEQPEVWMHQHAWGDSAGLPPGDQGFLQTVWERHGVGRKSTPDFDAMDWHRRGIARWQEVCPRQVVSYKMHVKPKGSVPPNARVVCFHGDPRPADLGWRLPC